MMLRHSPAPRQMAGYGFIDILGLVGGLLAPKPPAVCPPCVYAWWQQPPGAIALVGTGLAVGVALTLALRSR